MHQEMTIEPFGPAAALVLSDAEVADLGGGKRAAVVVTIGEQSVRLRLRIDSACVCVGSLRVSWI